MEGKLTALDIVAPGLMSFAWDDGSMATIDFWQIIATKDVLAPLRDPEEFALAVLSEDGWTVEWPCGVEFSAKQLRRWAERQGARRGTAAKH